VVVAIWKRRPGRLPAPPPSARPASESNTPPAEFLAAPPVLRALLGKDSEVSGKLSFSGPTRIDGTLRGEVRGTDVLVIGECGYVNGTIRAPTVLILGRVEGEILGAERVEIAAAGAVCGTVEARNLIVHDGGQLDGECRVGPPRATVHVLRPRADAPKG
jgi:cytoskeletal protein CcmA (bactofilin family)